jgi:cellobiose phosphorylase
MKDDGLIKLLTPPFDDGDLEPGYIKGYVPGVRENGGQYTHAAAWTIIAFAILGKGEMAYELFEMINPINHSKTHMEYSIYKVEPYVIAADVYSSPPHVGRGGWTWYTGSSGWLYKAGVEHVLGFKKTGDAFTIDPCIPSGWTEFLIEYKHNNEKYKISIKNPAGVLKGVKEIYLDGVLCRNKIVPLASDSLSHAVEVIMG